MSLASGRSFRPHPPAALAERRAGQLRAIAAPVRRRPGGDRSAARPRLARRGRAYRPAPRERIEHEVAEVRRGAARATCSRIARISAAARRDRGRAADPDGARRRRAGGPPVRRDRRRAQRLGGGGQAGARLRRRAGRSGLRRRLGPRPRHRRRRASRRAAGGTIGGDRQRHRHRLSARAPRRCRSRSRSQGLLLAEQPPGTEPRGSHFPSRNRIIAGLAAGTLVVEAAPKSGSLITARLAAEAGREVMAIPGSPLEPRAQGCNQLIREGAVLVQTPEDVDRAAVELRRHPALDLPRAAH